MIFNSTEEKKTRKYFRKGIKVKRAILFLCISLILLLSLIFNNQLEFLLRLKPNLSALKQANFEVHFVDVGQGDATLIRLPNNKTIMVDFGPKDSFAKLDRYIKNVFFRNGENRFDYIVLTHSDIDHSGNLEAIIQNYEIGKIFYSLDLQERSNYDDFTNLVKNIPTQVNEAGLNISGENFFIKWLTPNLEYYSESNDYSAVLYFEICDYKFMLMGDATSEIGEIEAINNLDYDCDIDLLKVAHHGSSTSTSLLFLETVKPENIVISNGNLYGHPSSSMLYRLATYDSLYNTNLMNYYSTLNDGNIILYDGNFMTIKNINNFLFLNYYLIIIVVVLTLLIIAFIPTHLTKEEWIVYLRYKKIFNIK